MAITLDDFYLEVSEFGPYQIISVLLLTIGSCFINVQNQFANVYLLYTPEHRCRLHQNETAEDGSFEQNQLFANFGDGRIYLVTAGECSLQLLPANHSQNLSANISLTEVDYYRNFTLETVNNSCPFGHMFSRQYFDATVITQWDLVCDRKLDGKLLLMFIGISAAIGVFVLSWFQDRFGRRVCFVVHTIMYLGTSLLTLLSPNFLVYAILRTLNAFPMHPAWNCSYTWAMEYIGVSKRTLTSTIHTCMYGFAAMSVVGVASLCRTWQQITYATTVPWFAAFLVCFMVSESPRWLLQQGKTDDAKKVLQRIARFSKNPRPDLVEDLLQQSEKIKAQKAAVKSSVKENWFRSMGVAILYAWFDVSSLFRGPILRKKTLLLTFIWISNCIVYAAIPFNAENVSGNFFLASVLSAGADIPATLLNLVVLNRFGRVWPIFWAMLVTGLAGILCAPGDAYPADVVIFLAFLAKFGIAMSWDALFQVAEEIYPTVVRGTGLGFTDTVGELGAVIMPFILLASSAQKQLPMILLGALTLVSAFFMLFLPETRGQHMPETLVDGETFGTVGTASLKDNIRNLRTYCKKQ